VADPLHVELVAADRTVWSGDATIVITRTADGDIGVLSDHAPLLSVLVEGTVEIRTPDGDYLVAAVSGGFLSVANNRVSVLAESAEMSDEIDLEAARAELERAQGSDEEDDGAAVRAAEARIRAVEKAR
jgi:F-type H+-transporting ATPase subunit epsilon